MREEAAGGTEVCAFGAKGGGAVLRKAADALAGLAASAAVAKRALRVWGGAQVED